MHVEPVHTALVDHLRLARAEGVGPAAWRRLLGRYGSPAQALEALPALAKMGGRSEAPRVPSAAEACRELEGLRALGGRLLVLGQPGYPALLALLDDAPPILSVVGDVATLSERAVALVGGRNASANGQRMAATLAEELAAAGLVIVSGLARGVDAAAHTGALRSGRTVAAVAGGQALPARARRATAPRHRGGRGVDRGAARHGAAGPALSAPQPPDRGAGAWGGGDRGRAALGQPHHRAARTGSGAGAVRRSRLAPGPARGAPTISSASARTSPRQHPTS
jgi:DNA recombination-mediator protein A